MKDTKIIHYYRKTKPPHNLLHHLQTTLHQKLSTSTKLLSLQTETCFNVEVTRDPTPSETKKIEWLLSETFTEDQLFSLEKSSLEANEGIKLEFGPRMNFTSAFSSNATSISSDCGISCIKRLERSKLYLIKVDNSLSDEELAVIKSLLHDRMTEEEYKVPITSFSIPHDPEGKVRTIPIMTQGKEALYKINQELGLGFDEQDVEYYTNLFQSLERDPTIVEVFDMGQSNSEHSRHWFFGGKMILNGETKSKTLFELVKETNAASKNSVIAFHDNSSAIRGYECDVITPSAVDGAGFYQIKKRVLHPILTAETHNFPSGVAPFPGAETGTGGRLRDVMSTGRGAYCIAGVAAYCVGNLNIPGYALPWEDKGFEYPSNLASPLQIILEASHGASDYGNKFGEPVILGFTRSFGQRLSNKERYEFVKPIMFSAGIGVMDDTHTMKQAPSPPMLVAKIGGPAYRIGIGGGAASSRLSSSDLDFDAVQRGDAEMGNRLMRMVRACCDLEQQNPILSIHDQGAGGNGNVLKEIVEPCGANYDIRKVLLGDETLTALEIWGAEYQENNAILFHPAKQELLQRIADRENCPLQIVGSVTSDGNVVVIDSKYDQTVVDLPLSCVLGKMPQKTFYDDSVQNSITCAFKVTDVYESINRVLRLLSVGSKRFLVNKVDRSVTGLIAQQQCVGALQLPLSNFAITAHSHFSNTGTAVSVGEQPRIGLINPGAMARMVIAESMTNLVFCGISAIEDIKASCNWMYAAKLKGEGVKMYEACEALSNGLKVLGWGIDGGKDSLSMAASCNGEVVKAPGEMTLTTYVTVPDITNTITPNLKVRELGFDTDLIFVDLSMGYGRLGGSSLAQVYNEIGTTTPDIDLLLLKSAFETTQCFLKSNKLLSGHDKSDGGIIVTLLEMAFAGNCTNMDITLECVKKYQEDPVISTLFNEEVGFVLEVKPEYTSEIVHGYKEAGVPCIPIGKAAATSTKNDVITISVVEEFEKNTLFKFEKKMTELRDTWEETSFELEKLQRNPECVLQEQENLKYRSIPRWKLSFNSIPVSVNKHKVVVLRQEGSNGDREMASAFLTAGFDVLDVTTRDLLSGNFTLDESIRGLAFVGGFSYADVLDSAKGWGGVILFNDNVRSQLEAFRQRKNTFSLGVCNGCQLMALLGWVNPNPTQEVRLLENESERYESRFVSVKIESSPSILLKGMEGSSLGVWISHGEGRFYFPSSTSTPKSNIPLRYIDDNNNVTTSYPFNPNGSPEGIAALCSEDGRHLAMMPHPERAFLKWQWPWMPLEWKESLEVSPWLRMFQNAKVFCDGC